jgi:hypothetical protein
MSENYSDYISVPTGSMLKQKGKINFNGWAQFASNPSSRFIVPDPSRERCFKVFRHRLDLQS